MKKSKAKKSLFASSAPPPKVRVKGASSKISMSDMRLEYNGLLAILAALIEVNNGQVFVDEDVLKTVIRDGRVIQIVPGKLGTTLKFESTDAKEADQQLEKMETEVKDFLNSDVAAEAREFLAKQRKKEDGTQD